MHRRIAYAVLGGLTLAGLAAACGASNSGSPGGSGGDGGHSDATSSGSGGSSGSGSGGSSGSGSGGSSGSGSGGSSGSGSGGSSGGSSGGGSGGSSGGGSGSSSGSSGGTDAGVDSGPPPYDPSVYQHHKNGTRDGVYIDKAFGQSLAGTTHVLTGFMGTVSTNVYAQPLYVENGPGGAEIFIVATENNHVTSYNATTGAIVWDTGPTVLGTPLAGNPPGGSGYGPTGITGTPYIDIASHTIFFDAMLTPDSGKTQHHTVYALNIDTGAIQTGWPTTGVDVNTAAAGFDSGVQSQRGALQFLNGVLYVPYGGYGGDGGNYYGSVVGFPVATPTKPTWWHTTALKGGVWGPGALPTDGVSIFPVTGNTTGTKQLDAGVYAWGGGEAVIRLGAGPTFSGNTADYYAPSNWHDLDDGDTDLGGASEVILDMPGAKYPHLVVAGGKDGNMYVLNRDNLGGTNPTTDTSLLTMQVGNNQIKGAPAAYTSLVGTYVAFHIEGGSGASCPPKEGGNLVVVQISQSATAVTAKTAWCSTQSGLASPMVTTTDGKSEPIVWNASNALYGWNGDTGVLIVDGTKTKMGTGIQGWNTPINANGRMAVGVNGQLYVFTP